MRRLASILTRCRLVAVGFIALPIAAACIFFGAMNALARYEAKRAGLPEAARNSIQHAYAAAETYAAFRALGFAPPTAEAFVIRLGYLNELLENRIQRRDDTTAEIYKDLNNNMSGIVAAEWLAPCGLLRPRKRLRLISKLAERRAIYYLDDDTRIPPLPEAPDVDAAITRFEADRETIGRRVAAALDALGRSCG